MSRGGLEPHELEIAEEIAAEQGLPVGLLDELVALERSPVGRRGRHGINTKVDKAIQQAARGKARKSRRSSSKRAAPSEWELTDVGEGSFEAVRLVSLELANFRIFREARLELATEPERPVHVVEGSNGYGKSTLVEAIRYALHGDISRNGLGAVISQSTPPSSATVRVQLALDDEPEGRVLVTRVANCEYGSAGWKVRGTPELVVALGGQQLRGDKAREWLHHAFPPKVMQYFVFDAEHSPVTDLAQHAGSTGHDVREQVEDALGITPLRKLAERCLEIGDKYEAEGRTELPKPKVVEAELRACEARLEGLRASGEELQEKRSRRQDALLEVEAELEELTQKADPDASAKRQKLVGELEQVQAELGQSRERLRRWLGEVLPVRLVHRRIQSARAAMSTEETRSQDWFQGAHSAVEGVGRLAAGGRLPWARTTWDEDRIARHLRAALGLTEHPEPLDTRRAEALEHLERIARRAEEFSTHRIAPQDIDDLEEWRGDLTRQLQTLDRTWDRGEALQRVARLMGDKQRLGKLIDELERESDEIERAIADETSEHSARERLLPEAQEAQRRKELMKSRAALARSCASVLVELAARLRDDRIEVLERAATIMFRRLTNKPDFYDRIAFDRQTLRYRLLGHDGQEVPVERSTGERTVLALSLVHGLQQASRRRFPLVIEAPLKPLDATHTSRVLDYFLAGARSQTVLLVKPGELTDDMRSHIRHRLAGRHVLHRPRPEIEASVIESV